MKAYYDQIIMEHNLIMKMLNVINRTLEFVTITQSIDPYFVDNAVDFIRVYADRTHHGKEEDILFKALRKNNLSMEDLQMMDDLIEDHLFFRITTNNLFEVNKFYRNGDESLLNDLISLLKSLVNYYPKHIKKETNIFFPATQNYLSQNEDQRMINEFWEYDRMMIHEKYENVVKGFQEKKNVKKS